MSNPCLRRRRAMLMMFLLMMVMVSVWHWLSPMSALCLPDYLHSRRKNGESLCAWTGSNIVKMDITRKPTQRTVQQIPSRSNKTNRKNETEDKKHKEEDEKILASLKNYTHPESLPDWEGPKKAAVKTTPRPKSVKKQANNTQTDRPAAKRELITEDTASKIVAMARNVTAGKEGPLLLTIINRGYLPMTFNWLCHTVDIPGIHDRIIFLVQGEDTQKVLNKRWPNLKTVTVQQSHNELAGPLKFGTVGYVRMMVRRTDLLNALIQAKLRLVLFETDFIWFKDPVPDFIAMGEKKNLDLVGTLSTAKTQIMCGAFIYFRNTKRMRSLWAEVTRQMHDLEERVHSKKDSDKAPYQQNEQVFLNRLLEQKYMGAKYGLVDYGSVVDGRWYKMKAAKRANMTPKAIHNNFLYSSQDKIKRFSRFGQWVLNRDLACNRTKVDKLLRSGVKR